MLDLEKSEVDPGLQNIANADEDSIDYDVLSSVLGFRAFGLPYWNAGTESTNSEANNKSADYKLRKLEARALQYFAH